MRILLAGLLGFLYVCIQLVACTPQPVSSTHIVLGVYRGGLINMFNPHQAYIIGTDRNEETSAVLPTGLGYEPKWSPDGQWIVFVDRSRDYNSPILSLMKSDGRRRIRINAHPEGAFHPTWSPDGIHIAYFAYGSPTGIYSLAIECLLHEEDCHPQPTFLTKGQTPDWSPNGQQIVYDSVKSGTSRKVFVINVDGKGDPLELLPNMNSCFTPRWSPDGQKIVVSCNGNIYLVNPDGSGSKILSEGRYDYNPQWSHDGSKIAFVSSRDDLGKMIGWEVYSDSIFLMNSDGSNVIRIGKRDDEKILWYTWLPSQLASTKP